MLGYDAFYMGMQQRLAEQLPDKVLACKPLYKVRSNRMQIYLDGITGTHYEICLRRDYHEIALHFESTPERSLERRQVFDPLLDQLSASVGVWVRSGPLENQGWMRVWIEQPIVPITDALMLAYSTTFSRFITATFPVLESIYP